MYEQVNKPKENKSKAVAQKKSGNASTFQFVDNRPEAIAQQKVQVMANNHAAQQFQPIQKKENNAGLPDNLKSGIESLSGYSMDDVKVHYNSDKPSQLQAHAYAQGTDIHLASGQEKHLPHEAWHVVQQKQGRVKPTMQMKDKVNVNDDVGLEKEADVMGETALKAGSGVVKQGFGFVDKRPEAVAQRMIYIGQQPRSTSSIARRGAETIARSIAPDLVEEIMAEYDRWVRDTTVRGRRFNSINHAMTTIATHIRRAGSHRPAVQTPQHPHSSGSQAPALAERTGRDAVTTPVSRTLPVSGSISTAPINAVVPSGRLRGGRAQLGNLRDVAWPRSLRPEAGDLVYGVDAERSNLMRGAQSSNRSLFPSTHMELGRGQASVPFYINPLNDALLSSSPSFRQALVPSTDGQNMLGRYRTFVEGHAPPSGHESEAANVLEYWGRQSGGTQTRRGKFATLSKLGVNFTHSERHHIYFGLTTFSVESALNPRNEYYGAVTSQELRHYYHNRAELCPQIDQDRLQENTVIFIRQGNIVLPPWEETAYRNMFEGYERSVVPGRTRSDSLATQYPVRSATTGSERPTDSSLSSGTSEVGVSARQQQVGSTNTEIEGVQPIANPGAIAAPAVHNLDAGGMILHYHAAIGWANQQGTYSNEFHYVRNNPDPAQSLLQNAGMAAVNTQQFTQGFLAAVGQQDRGMEEYVPADIQEIILGQLGNDEQLLAIIRYLQHNNE